MKIDTKEIREGLDIWAFRPLISSKTVHSLCDRIDELENMLAEMLDDEADSGTWAKAINVLEGKYCRG